MTSASAPMPLATAVAASADARRIMYYYGAHHLDSGSPRALLGVIDLLDRRRIQPLFLASGDGPLVDALADRSVEIVRGGVAPISGSRPAAAARAIRRQMAMLRRHGVDILHMNEFGWNQDLVLAAWLARIPVVLHMHLPDMIGWQNLNRFAARRVVLVSGAHAEMVGGFDRIAKKARVLYNPVDLARYASGRSLRTELGLRKNDVVVGTVAQIRHGKGIDVLLDAARRLLPRHPELVFLVAGRAGNGEEAYAREMRAAANAPELAGRVRFLGSRSDVANLLATFDAFVLPTRTETFGIVLVEAMSAGVPVIASGVGAVPEILDSPAVGCVVKDIDGAAFAEAIERVLAQPDRGRAMGRRGRASLAGRFDHATLSAQLHRIYAELE